MCPIGSQGTLSEIQRPVVLAGGEVRRRGERIIEVSMRIEWRQFEGALRVIDRLMALTFERMHRAFEQPSERVIRVRPYSEVVGLLGDVELLR